MDPQPSPSEQLRREDLHLAILDILESLPPRQSLLVRLVVEHIDHLSPRHQHVPLAEALSDVTGQTENVEAVRSLWRNARDHLAAELLRRGFHLDPRLW